MMKIINGLAFEAYTKILGSRDFGEIQYAKGAIGGLESLLQNLEDTRDEMRDLIASEREEVDDDMTAEMKRRAVELGIGEEDEDV